jgi:hypothetical protein
LAWARAAMVGMMGASTRSMRTAGDFIDDV